jgi:hypothetical protein
MDEGAAMYTEEMCMLHAVIMLCFCTNFNDSAPSTEVPKLRLGQGCPCPKIGQGCPKKLALRLGTNCGNIFGKQIGKLFVFTICFDAGLVTCDL